MTTPQLTKSIGRSPFRLGLFITALGLACFALLPNAYAVCQNGCGSNDNTFLGDNALISNTSGADNTAIGKAALSSNTTGSTNTATGVNALTTNTTGGANTVDGWNALFSNTTGSFNTATGADALLFNTTGNDNNADGFAALQNNTTGSFNTATGAAALLSNTTGNDNTADGFDALVVNSGSDNTADGFSALKHNTTGSSNIALGSNAGLNLTAESNNIDIGNKGVAGESNTIRIGKAGTQTATFIAGITGTTVSGGVGVIIGSNGKLGTIVSSARFKDEIKPMDKASEVILALKPVTFRYKKELDPERIPQFGLVAEDVEKVNPALVARDEQGKPYTVRYEAVNSMLLNEFLKAHRRMEEQGKRIEELTVQLKQQAAQIQKVSAQLELDKRGPQTVSNDH